MHDSTPDWFGAEQHLRTQLCAWIGEAVERHRNTPYHGIHDEGSFTASWDAYYFLTRDEKVVQFLAWLRDGFIAWGENNLFHGYYPEGEVHHGTEPFTHFVARFRTLTPGDPATARLLDDVAHHTGNWVPEVPAWYDWQTHRMLSWRIGSRKVPTGPPNDYEEPDSIRPAMIALAAHLATGDERYLAFCLDYGDKWARALLEEPLPRVRFMKSPAKRYRDRLSEQAAGDLFMRTELVVASGMVDYLLDLIVLTDRPLYRRAMKRIMGALVEVVADPRDSVAAAHLAKYRRITGDRRFDEEIVGRLGRPPRHDEGGFAILDTRDEHVRRKPGMIFNRHIGHRYDQIRWGRADGTEMTEPTGSAWALAWQITGDPAYAARALYLGGERVGMGREKLEDGRDHGCAGNTLGAVASGHGRADRFGHVNAVFGPITQGSIRLFSAEEPLVVYPEGLPESVGSLVACAPQPRVTWYNASEEPVTIRWRDASASPNAEIREVKIGPGETKDAALAGCLPKAVARAVPLNPPDSAAAGHSPNQ